MPCLEHFFFALLEKDHINRQTYNKPTHQKFLAVVTNISIIVLSIFSFNSHIVAMKVSFNLFYASFM